MNEPYATAKVAYQELRAAIDPWARANGFTRTKGAPAGWDKPLDEREWLGFRFECARFVVADTGSSFHSYVQLEPLESPRGSEILRQSDFGCCLVQSELDQFAWIQGAINGRRPPLPADMAKHLFDDTILGHGLREERNREPTFSEGAILQFGFHSVRDVKDLAAFIARVLPDALQRFIEGRVAKPVSTTPKHLVPKWLDRVTKLPDDAT